MTGGLVHAAGGWLLALVAAAVVIAAIVTLRAVWPNFGGADDDARSDPAIERLRERYARGEIDEAEFERRRAYLDEAGPR